MPKKYLELESTYRNRNLFPNQASFDVQISQSGLNSQCAAVDPITDAYPDKTFSIQDETATGTINTFTGGVLNVNSQTKFLVSINTILSPTTTPSNNIMINNYYVGAGFFSKFSTGNLIYIARILEWIYITTTSNSTVFSVMTDASLPADFGGKIFNIGQMSNIVGTYDNYGPQQIFIPFSEMAPNIYNNYYLFNQTQSSKLSSTGPAYTTITNFDEDTHLAYAQTNVSAWKITDVLVLRKLLPNKYSGSYNLVNAPLPVYPIGTIGLNQTLNICTLGMPPTGTTSVIGDPSYINAFVRYYPQKTSTTQLPTEPVVTRIVGCVVLVSGGSIQTPFYTVDTTGNLYTQYVNNPSNSGNVTPIVLSSTQWIATVDPIPQDYFIEIMPYKCDNFSPFVYNGSMASQNQTVAYEVSLNSLILPNVALSAGGRIAYYPYVYVEIENIGSSSSNINTTYSNNPNTYKAIFKVPITDLNHPKTSPYIKLTGNGMEQTIPFKINSDMRVSVKLPDGSLFKTNRYDNTTGQRPNPLLQVSFTFEVSRV